MSLPVIILMFLLVLLFLWLTKEKQPSSDQRHQLTKPLEKQPSSDQRHQLTKPKPLEKQPSSDQRHQLTKPKPLEKQPSSDQQHQLTQQKKDPWDDQKYQLTRLELGRDFAHVYRKIWAWDLGRLDHAVDYVFDREDPLHFITYDGKKLELRPTYKVFIDALKHFRNAQDNPTTQAQETFIVNALLKEVLDTPVFFYVYNALRRTALHPPRNYQDFKRQVMSLWFQSNGSSCLFNHVFVGEIVNKKKKGKITAKKSAKGLHSYLQAKLEQDLTQIIIQKADFYDALSTTTISEPRLVQLKFDWFRGGKWYSKAASTMFVGTSPEFDMALYSYCALKGDETAIQEDNEVKNGSQSVKILVYRENRIVTAIYPEVS